LWLTTLVAIGLRQVWGAPLSGWDRETWDGVILPPGVRKILELWGYPHPGFASSFCL
jgi:hypothetical protein